VTTHDKQTLAQFYYPFVQSLARQRLKTGVPYEDLLSAAHLGLVKALDTYDPTLHTKPATWIYWKVRGELRKVIREHRRYREHEVNVDFSEADRSGGSLGRALRQRSEDHYTQGGNISAKVRDAVNDLPFPERAVIKLRYGLGLNRRYLPWQISERFGWSRRTVHYYLDKAKNQLYVALKGLAHV
jgi:RNA polymerase sigma factor (sigma-70 family)